MYTVRCFDMIYKGERLLLAYLWMLIASTMQVSAQIASTTTPLLPRYNFFWRSMHNCINQNLNRLPQALCIPFSPSYYTITLWLWDMLFFYINTKINLLGRLKPSPAPRIYFMGRVTLPKTIFLFYSKNSFKSLNIKEQIKRWNYCTMVIVNYR